MHTKLPASLSYFCTIQCTPIYQLACLIFVVGFDRRPSFRNRIDDHAGNPPGFRRITALHRSSFWLLSSCSSSWLRLLWWSHVVVKLQSRMLSNWGWAVSLPVHRARIFVWGRDGVPYCPVNCKEEKIYKKNETERTVSLRTIESPLTGYRSESLRANATIRD